jgi:EAL domain-containing protein (putative c-di-GMP-specific phosphodiesterase class I)
MPTLDLDLVPVLERAIDDDALVLHFQPEVDLATGAVVGMEALLRWQHPSRGLLWPAEFLAVAEASGLLPLLGWWVLERCAEEVQTWGSMPPSPLGEQRRMWVNIGGAQLADPDFIESVAALVERRGIPRGMLGLEVTETALAGGVEDPVATLRRLRDAGVALAVDDFGTWYSTLATLGELPVDAVKLDRSFVRGVGSDLEGDDIVASVIRLAHAHNLTVVAEGVESWAEGARLCELGCDRALGYLFSGPQPASRARFMLARGTGWRRPVGDTATAAGVPSPRGLAAQPWGRPPA